MSTLSTWYIIDAANCVPGKVAEAAARHLAGKHRADYTPARDLGDGVIVINAAKVRLTGSKLVNKLYRTHSGYRGHLKEVSAGTMLEKKPTNIVKLAVYGMLPKNRLRDDRMLRLKVYAGAEHAHSAQQPVTITL